MLVAPHHQLWQPKMSPGIAQCLVGSILPPAEITLLEVGAWKISHKEYEVDVTNWYATHSKRELNKKGSSVEQKLRHSPL